MNTQQAHAIVTTLSQTGSTSVQVHKETDESYEQTKQLLDALGVAYDVTAYPDGIVFESLTIRAKDGDVTVFSPTGYQTPPIARLASRPSEIDALDRVELTDAGRAALKVA